MNERRSGLNGDVEEYEVGNDRMKMLLDATPRKPPPNAKLRGASRSAAMVNARWKEGEDNTIVSSSASFYQSGLTHTDCTA